VPISRSGRDRGFTSFLPASLNPAGVTFHFISERLVSDNSESQKASASNDQRIEEVSGDRESREADQADDQRAEERKKLLEEAIERREKAENSVVQTGRRAFVVALVGILLNPFSVLTGFYINHLLQKPEFRIETVNENYEVENHVFPPDNVKSLQTNPLLLGGLRETISRTSQSEDCTAWLDGGDWIDSCFDPVDNVARGVRGTLIADIDVLKNDIALITSSDGSHLPHLQPTTTMSGPELFLMSFRGDKNAMLAALNSQLITATDTLKRMDLLQKTLADMRAISDTPRTGKVTLAVGITNTGDADGVIQIVGQLQFDNKELPIVANEFTVVKAHSFARISFDVNEDTAKADVLQSWKDAIKKGTTPKYTVVMNPKEKPFSKSEDN
jgi:hypothetical protein